MFQTLGHLFRPLFQAISWVLAFCYNIIPNYAVAIALLTLIVMIAIAPLTFKSTRSSVEMQRLQPEINKIRQKYKNDRVAQTQAMGELFKEHKVNPAGGCLPALLPLPIFIVLYEVVRGLTFTIHRGHSVVASPRYISHHTLLYQHLVAGKGTMYAFGIDLARSALSVHGGFLAALPYYLLIAAAMGVQFLQIRQLMGRNSANANLSPQAKQMQQFQKFMPLGLGAIYISFPAAVTVYMLTSSVLRMLQQTLMYRFDPVIKGAHSPVVTTTAQVSKPDAAKPAGAKAKEGSAKAGAMAKKTPPPAKDDRRPPRPQGQQARVTANRTGQGRKRSRRSR